MVKLWVRILLAVLGVVVLLATVPAIFSPSANPVLADLTAHTTLSAVFISRQLSIALTSLYGAWRGSGNAVLVGALPMFLFNAFDTVAILLMQGVVPVLIFGIVLAVLAAIVMWFAYRRLQAYE